MNIDILNAYCGLQLVCNPCLAQGRLLHPSQPAACGGCRHWAFFAAIALFLRKVSRVALRCDRVRGSGSLVLSVKLSKIFTEREAGFPCLERHGRGISTSPAGHIIFRPESRQDYPPNLSILISGGKENNCDALSNGE
jgi:hypothetical protein